VSHDDVANWILGDAEPSPTLVFAIEELLDVHAGALSRLLGYLPLGPVAASLKVEDVVANSSQVDEDCKRALLSIWHELVRRHKDGRDTRELRVLQGQSGLPRAGRHAGTPLVDHKRDFGLELRDRGRAESTVRNHLAAVEQFYRYLRRNGHAGTDLAVIQSDIAGFFDEVGAAATPAVVMGRYRALNRLFQWLVDEGELRRNPMVGMRYKGEVKPK
jgi:hypothetical protein